MPVTIVLYGDDYVERIYSIYLEIKDIIYTVGSPSGSYHDLYFEINNDGRFHLMLFYKGPYPLTGGSEGSYDPLENKQALFKYIFCLNCDCLS